MKLKSLLPLTVLFLVFVQEAFSQYKINVDIKDCKDTALVLGYYYLDKTYALDTAFSKSGDFKFRNKEKKLDDGIYFFSTFDGRFCEFIIDKDMNFTLKTQEGDWAGQMKVRGSKPSEQYFEYIKASNLLSDKARELSMRKDSLTKEEYDEKIKVLRLQNDTLKEEFIKKYPDNLLSKVLQATKPVIVPQMEVPVNDEGTQDSALWNMQRWVYYKHHYFDNVDLTCDGLLHTPAAVFYRNYNRYWDEVMKYESNDSILYYASLLIDKSRGSEKMFRFLLHNITERYLQSPIMGHDKIYVEMIKRYFKSGEADWLAPSDIEKEVARAEKWENLLIGKLVPNIACPDTNNIWHDVYSLEADYKIVIFWSPDCGHCSTEIPKLYDFYSKNRDKYKIKVFAINTEDNIEHWKKFIVEKGLNWINVNGLVANFDWRDYFDIVKTPVIFILNKDNVIVAKNVQADNMEAIMELLKEGKLKF